MLSVLVFDLLPASGDGFVVDVFFLGGGAVYVFSLLVNQLPQIVS